MTKGVNTKPSNILFVEKDEALRLKAVEALEAAGYEVVTAADAMDGLKKLDETHPDLIIIELPMENGEDDYLRIRQASYLPIIVVGSREETAEMLEFGADAYVPKPLSLVELVARVRALLRRKPRQNPPGDNIAADTRKRPPEAEADSTQAENPNN